MSDLANLAAGVPVPAPGETVYTPAINLTEKQVLWTQDRIRLSVLANPMWLTSDKGVSYTLEESDDGESWSIATGAVSWQVGTRNDMSASGAVATVKAPSMFASGYGVWRPSPSCWGRLNRALKDFIRLKVALASGLWAVPQYHSIVLGYVPPGDWVGENLSHPLPGTHLKPAGWNPGVAVGGPAGGQSGGAPPVFTGGGGGGGSERPPTINPPVEKPFPEIILNQFYR